jgi:3-oxoacyl-[acyl-carrier-protein] synthase-1
MENKVFMSYGTLISPIGIGVEENFHSLKSGISGIKKQKDSGFKGEDWFLSKIEFIQENRFDSLLKRSLEEIKKTHTLAMLSSKKTLFILSSTKGNIDVLPADVFASARKLIKEETNNPNDVIVISNACISGVIAINTAADYLRYADFDTVIVIGIDTISDFVLFGFQSLFALSDEPAQPFDKNRKGISLGEACGIVVLSKEKPDTFSVEYISGASSNDANHISGPSRTGEGLFRAINKTVERAGIDKTNIDFVSAHGTGTLYNDEMESIAFTRCELQTVLTNSLKGFFGHTLGAAGIIETIVCMLSIQHQLVFESKGFNEIGTTQEINLVKQTQPTSIQTVLKTASGFGGGNAALLIKQVI